MSPGLPSKTAVASIFDELASHWDDLYRTRSDFTVRLIVVGEILTDILSRYHQPSVLDVGGGTGVVATMAAREAAHVIVVDRSEDMLRAGLPQRPIARGPGDPGPAKGHAHVSRLIADANALPLSARFDVIVCIAVLEWLGDVDRAIAEMAALLSHDGVLVLSVPRPHSWYRRLESTLDHAISWLDRILDAGWTRSRRYSIARPHGSSPPWRRALTQNGLELESTYGLALGTRGWRSWVFPSQLLVAGPSPPMTTRGSSSRYASEARFHDDAHSYRHRRRVAPFYRIIANCRQRFLSSVNAGPGTRVLEVGCGQGQTAVSIARQGAEVHAIDLSGRALKEASAAAEADGWAINYQLMSGEELAYSDAAFDLVYGSGVLHHLELHKALAETTRVLRPGGRAVFMEPLGHNPLIGLFRRATPGLRTRDEHPLVMADLDLLRNTFSTVDAEFFGLFALVALPLVQTRVAPAVLRPLWRLDAFVFDRWPSLRRYAWYTVLTLSDPRQGPTSGD